MTLPASGQIEMSQVRTELSASGQISLGQGTVRTLFGDPSGQINMSDGYGKSATVTAIRPNKYTYSTLLMTNPTYAYDTTASTIDTSTYADVNTTAKGSTTFLFAAGTSSKVLHIYIPSYATDDSFSVNELNEAISTISVAISLDSGTSWTFLLTDSAGGTGSGNTLTYQLSNQNLSSLQVKVAYQGQISGPVSSRAAAFASIQVSDIVIY
jgi:hypothetical protein